MLKINQSNQIESKKVGLFNYRLIFVNVLVQMRVQLDVLVQFRHLHSITIGIILQLNSLMMKSMLLLKEHQIQ